MFLSKVFRPVSSFIKIGNCTVFHKVMIMAYAYGTELSLGPLFYFLALMPIIAALNLGQTKADIANRQSCQDKNISEDKSLCFLLIFFIL